MVVLITHKKIATYADQPDAEINKAEWNDTHEVTGVVETVNGQTGVVVLNTDDIAEDASPVNLWFTDARAISALSSTLANYLLSSTAASTYVPLSRTINGQALSSNITLTTSNISEGSNLYYTDARARGAISLTTTGTSGASTYNSTTGVLNIPQYSSGVTALSAIGSTPNANAGTITGSTLNLEPASSSFGGVVTTGTQSFAGSKTFLSPILSPGAGSGSIRIGASTLADGTGDIAIGNSASAAGGFGNVLIGRAATSTSFYNTIIGDGGVATSLYGTGIGYNVRVGYFTVAVGALLNVPDFAVHLGTALTNGAVNIGYNNSASNSTAMTIGNGLTASDRELHIGVNLTGYRFTDLWFTGGKESSSADTYGPLRLHAVRGSGANNKGQDLVMQPGASTGNLAGGSFKVETAPAGASGTTLGTSTTRLEIDGAGNSIFSGPVRLKGYTVATLPAGVLGNTAFVTDALAPALGANVVGGGAINAMVWYNGANWTVTGI
jgi:hypothetical protein